MTCRFILLAVLLAASSTPAQSAPSPDALYRAALDKVLKEAQNKLQARTRLREERTWKNPWEISSEHFRVRSADTFIATKTLGSDLDLLTSSIEGLIRPGFDFPKSLPIWVTPNIATYNQIGGDGDQHSSIYGSHLGTDATQPVVVLTNPNFVYLKILTTHSVVHQYVAKAYPKTRAPAWVQEGLASYFSLYWDNRWGASELKRYRSEKRSIPVRFLLSRGPQNYPAQTAPQHFLELGMFFNYLLHFREDTRSTIDANKVQKGPFADYLRKVLANKSVADDPVHLLLFRNVAKVEADFRAQKF